MPHRLCQVVPVLRPAHPSLQPGHDVHVSSGSEGPVISLVDSCPPVGSQPAKVKLAIHTAQAQ